MKLKRIIRKFITGLAKFLLFCCFLVALAGFSGIATIRYIFATSTVEIPDLVGKDVIYVVDLLAELHLKLKAVDQQIDPKIPKDHILAQEPAPGTISKKNRTVRVVLSQGAGRAMIPEVIGKRWQTAKNTLRKNDFRLGNVAYTHSTEVPVDHIVAQSPFPHSEASIGDRVDLLVSLGPYKRVMVMPDLVEEHLSYALQAIERLGLVLSKVEHEPYPVSPNTVLSQVPKPGTLVEEGNIVTFVVSGEGTSMDLLPGETLPVQYESVAYIVPPGRFEREVTVIVRNAEGIAEMYRQFVPPGNRIVVQIPVVGETVVEIYLDGVLDDVRRIQNE